MPIGAHTTLRGDRMWEFLDRLVSVALPRIRDFRGLSPKQFDGQGNYTFGLNEQSMFHEIDQDRIDRVRGMDITVVTTATNDDEGRALLKQARVPLQGELTWRRPRSSTRRPASPSSRSAATPGASGAAVRTRCTASSACAASACARWRTAASLPGVTKSSLVTTTSQVRGSAPADTTARKGRNAR
ncbi:hypothetical protein GCM10025868_32910 [Angustibacter aerolatus]|uniref:50S ribosomal protein L5 n=1 Tax=Angustibacter aerolatus TaxID=1162965 RepID=A0ABQ6JMX4_9ACTN|nr:hypothetical protein GCM10025868_32910 [Angustibacter aerolatus]